MPARFVLVTAAVLVAAVAVGCAGPGRVASDAAARADIATPFAVAVAGDGAIFVADTGANRVLRVSPAGVIAIEAGDGHRGFSGDNGPAPASELNGPAGLALAPDGSLYIADELNHRVRRVSPAGVITTAAGVGQGGFNGGGFSGDGGPAIEAELSFPLGVGVAPDGSVYIADTGNDRVRRVSAGGIITTVAGDSKIGYSGDGVPAAAGRLNDPTDIVFTADGSSYIADQSNNRVRLVNPDGIITTVAGDGLFGFLGDDGPATSARLNIPTGIALGADGSVYIADRDNNRIRRVGPGGIITTVAGDGQAGFGGDGGPATAALLHGPSGVAVGPDGSLYIADTGNNRIRRVSPAGVITTVVGAGSSPFGSTHG